MQQYLSLLCSRWNQDKPHEMLVQEAKRSTLVFRWKVYSEMFLPLVCKLRNTYQGRRNRKPLYAPGLYHNLTVMYVYFSLFELLGSA